MDIEDKYISEYNSINSDFGYNKRFNNSFPILSQESIEKRKQKHDLHKIKIKLFYEDTGEFFMDFDSITDAAIYLKDQTTNISKVKNCETKSCKGFRIITSDNYIEGQLYPKKKADMS